MHICSPMACFFYLSFSEQRLIWCHVFVSYSPHIYFHFFPINFCLFFYLFMVFFIPFTNSQLWHNKVSNARTISVSIHMKHRATNIGNVIITQLSWKHAEMVWHSMHRTRNSWRKTVITYTMWSVATEPSSVINYLFLSFTVHRAP